MEKKKNNTPIVVPFKAEARFEFSVDNGETFCVGEWVITTAVFDVNPDLITDFRIHVRKLNNE